MTWLTIWNKYSFALLFFCAAAPVSLGMPKRKYFLLRAAAVFLCVIGFMTLYQEVISPVIPDKSFGNILQYFLYYSIFFFGFVFCYKTRYTSALFCTTISYCMQHIAFKTGASISTVVGLYAEFGAYFRVICVCLVACVLYTAVYFGFSRRNALALNTIDMDDLPQLLVTLVTLGVIIIIDFMFTRFLTRGTENRSILYMIEMIMSSLFAFIIIFYEYSLLSRKRIADENTRLQTLLDEERERYEHEKNNIEMINIKCHDIRHQLRAMSGNMDKNAVAEIVDAIRVYDASAKTGNEALDVVIDNQSLYCLSHGISFTCMVDGSELSFIPAHELYALFGNAIENAVHAVEKLDPEKRIISMVSRRANGFTDICISNYFDGNIQMSDGLPVSHNDGHGFGVKSMRAVVEKHGGMLSVRTYDDLFLLDMLFSLPPTPAASGGK